MREFQSPMTYDGEAKERIRVDRDRHTSRRAVAGQAIRFLGEPTRRQTLLTRCAIASRRAKVPRSAWPVTASGRQ